MHFDFLKEFYSRILKREKRNSFGYFGTFPSWELAKGELVGYADPEIACQVAKAAAKVAVGEAAYERDSVLFQSIQYSYPLSTALLWSASAHSGNLRVLDFGGGLGTSFFQNRPFLKYVKELKWVIIEQKSFVNESRKIFKDTSIMFSTNLEEELQTYNPTIAILSSSLQYVPNPWDVLQLIVNNNIDMIYMDRTLFTADDDDFATLQIVPKNIFNASIPVWVLSEKKFIQTVSSKYNIFSRFLATQSTVTLDNEKRQIEELGYLLVSKTSTLANCLHE